ncbi:MAG: DNA repair protein RadC [Opitutaceae bacterium]|nr:DNA repair protein RadC [Cytophagales bacterium]
MKITDWAETERPREKLLERGINALTDAELIAILIGSGTVSMSAVDLSREILSSVNNDLYKLSALSIKDLQKFKGIGEAKAISIVSALELGRRRKEKETIEKPRILCSKDAYEILKPDLTFLPYEEFWVILMNRANYVLKKVKIGQGGISETTADLRLAFKAAIDNLATTVLIAHNHPSGNLNPSNSDKELTRRFKESGKMLEITLADHLIITDRGYFSFADEGLI